MHYSLVPGVSFDLFDSLYKPDTPKTTTVHKVGLVAETLGYINYNTITPHYPALCSGYACVPSGMYTSQSTQWGVITNTYVIMYTLGLSLCIH